MTAVDTTPRPVERTSLGGLENAEALLRIAATCFDDEDGAVNVEKNDLLALIRTAISDITRADDLSPGIYNVIGAFLVVEVALQADMAVPTMGLVISPIQSTLQLAVDGLHSIVQGERDAREVSHD